MKITVLILIVIAVLEIILRVVGLGDPPTVVLDEDIEYYVTPNKTFKRFGNTIETNRYGMRSKDFSIDGNEDRQRQ